MELNKRFILILAVLYTIILTVASLITLHGIPKLGTDIDDKLYHVMAYLILFIIWYLTLKQPVSGKQMLYLALSCIAFGIIIEAIQGKVNVNRIGDILDIIANIAGVLIGVVISQKWMHRLS